MWDKCLKYDIDKEFLLKGLSSGFELVDSDKQYLVVEVEVNNHLSSVVTYKNSVENQILDELKEGNYIRTSKKPIVKKRRENKYNIPFIVLYEEYKKV